MLILRPLSFNFNDRPDTASWRARLFMLVALAAFALSLAHYADVSREKDAAIERVNALTAQKNRLHVQRTGPEAGSEKYTRLEASINVGWDKMLTAIERAMTENVAVIAV